MPQKPVNPYKKDPKPVDNRPLHEKIFSLYEEVTLDWEMRDYLNTKMSRIFEKTAKIIWAKEEAFPHEVEEKDLKEKINKWKAVERKNEVLHAINQLHLKDPVMSKKDLMQSLQAVNENFEVLKDSNGFDILE